MIKPWPSDLPSWPQAFKPQSFMTHFVLPPPPVTIDASSPRSVDIQRPTKRRRFNDHDPLSPVSEPDNDIARRVRPRSERDPVTIATAATADMSTEVATVAAAPATPSASPSPALDALHLFMPASPSPFLALSVPQPIDAVSNHVALPHPVPPRVREEIEIQLGLEILLKHNELRLINQELAKCQIALEQLRRCHLIPYPVNCPTPAQMLDIAAGKGPVFKSQPGQPVPRWAPPFGVVDGPYARHYAKWLIPDPVFDGLRPERRPVTGKSTRNSLSDHSGPGRPRIARSALGHRPSTISAGHYMSKDKHGPCIVRRSDKTVKLICPDCSRENFSSTQGFINHCRIAHHRDFKSHEEAARRCGQPVDLANPSSAIGPAPTAGPIAGPTAGSALATPFAPMPVSASIGDVSLCSPVHPFAKADLTEQEALTSLRARLAYSIKIYSTHRLVVKDAETCSLSAPSVLPMSSSVIGDVPGISNVSTATPGMDIDPVHFVPAAQTPYLSDLMQSRKFDGDLFHLVNEARTAVKPVDEHGSALLEDGFDLAKSPPISAWVSVPVASPLFGFSDTLPVDAAADDVNMDCNQTSPRTSHGHNAPSLVSDNGEDVESDVSFEAELGQGSGPGSHCLPIAESGPTIVENTDSLLSESRHHRTSTAAIMAPPPLPQLKVVPPAAQAVIPLVDPIPIPKPEPRRRGRPRKHPLPLTPNAKSSAGHA